MRNLFIIIVVIVIGFAPFAFAHGRLAGYLRIDYDNENDSYFAEP